MNIVYYTSGVTGSGRLVRGISIGNALRRTLFEFKYTIISNSPFASLADSLGFSHIKISLGTKEQLGAEMFGTSELYKAIMDINPDILIVDLLWFPLYHFIDKLPGKKIFLSRQVSDSFFSIPLENDLLQFDPQQYDKIISIEPFQSCIEMETINPIIFRNKNEIMDKQTALKKLNLSNDKPVCLLAYNGHPGDFQNVKKTYFYLEDEDYQMVYTTNYDGGIFPVVDYFNAFDLIICGAGYNAFWEIVYFNKEAIIVPTHTKFEDQQKRIDECSGMTFEENGADQLVDIILNL